jgi:hypothetical protein
MGGTLSSFSVPTKTYGDGAFTITEPVVVDSGLTTVWQYIYSSSDTSVATVSGNTITIVGAGSTYIDAYRIPVNVAFVGPQGGDDIATVFVVNKASVSLSNFTIGSKTIGNTFTIPTPGTTIAGSVSYSVVSGSATISGTSATVTTAGSVTIRATQAASRNYNEASIDATFTVNKNPVSLTVSKNKYITKYISNGNINFDVFSTNAELGYTRSFSSNNGGVISVPSASSPNVTIVGPGRTTINVTQNETTSYAAVTINSIIEFVIVGQNQSYTSENLTLVDLSGTNLSKSIFSSCNLTSVNLYNATVDGSTNLTSSTLTSITSGRITGFTTLLPVDFKMI